MDVDPITLGGEFLAAAALGCIIGYGTKRVAVVLAVVIGIQLVVGRYLEAQGIVTVDWEALTAGLVSTAERADADRLTSILSTTSVGTGFVTGFFIGYHRA